jgi:hypothetical protein
MAVCEIEIARLEGPGLDCIMQFLLCHNEHLKPWRRLRRYPWRRTGHYGFCGQNCGCCSARNKEDSGAMIFWSGCNCNSCINGWVWSTLSKAMRQLLPAFIQRNHPDKLQVQPTYDQVFAIPRHWCVNRLQPGNVVRHIEWYFWRYNVLPQDGSINLWAELDSSHSEALDRADRDLIMHIAAEHMLCPRGVANFNLHQAGVKALDRIRDDVTGVDFGVQALILSQEATLRVLLEVRNAIESGNLEEVCFTCTRGTQRSVACAMLLGILMYHNARIVFCTSRTQMDARAKGMVSDFQHLESFVKRSFSISD